jgi:hypothetical protein
MTIDTYELFEELRAVLRHYDAIHRTAEDARTAHATIERQISDIRRAYMDDIYADPAGKVKYSNQERRDAEAQRRLEAHWPDLLQEEQQAATAKREATAELERSTEALKTYRALAGLVESEKRIEAVMVDVASMPRIVTGRR